MKLQPLLLNEYELENLIVNEPGLVEEGFMVLSRQWPTDSGPLDILGADVEGTLVVVELKSKEDDTQIIQGLRYYDYILNNLTAIVKHFTNTGFNVTDQEEPRLMLIAPSFSHTIRKICKYLDVEVELKEYRAYMLPSGERALIFNTVEVEERRGVILYPTFEQKLRMIQDDIMREYAKNLVEELEKVGFEKRMIKGEWVSLRYSGRRIAYLGCKRRFFVVETDTSEGWKRIRVSSKEDYEKVLALLKDKIRSQE